MKNISITAIIMGIGITLCFIIIKYIGNIPTKDILGIYIGSTITIIGTMFGSYFAQKEIQNRKWAREDARNIYQKILYVIKEVIRMLKQDFSMVDSISEPQYIPSSGSHNWCWYTCWSLIKEKNYMLIDKNIRRHLEDLNNEMKKLSNIYSNNIIIKINKEKQSEIKNRIKNTLLKAKEIERLLIKKLEI